MTAFRAATLLALALAAPAPAPAASLVANGKAVAVVALPPGPDADERLAAAELVGHVEKMSGAKLDTVTVAPAALDAFLDRMRRDGTTPVVLGRAALPRLEAALARKGAVPGAFVLRATKSHVLAAGVGGGTPFAVCELLEQQGVRWFLPGPLGTVIARGEDRRRPRAGAGAGPVVPEPPVPDAGPRLAGACPLRRAGVPRGARAPGRAAVQDEPRAVRPRGRPARPEAALRLEPEGAGGRGRRGEGPAGAGARAGHRDGVERRPRVLRVPGLPQARRRRLRPVSNEPSVTDRYVWFFNRVLEELKPGHKDVKLAFDIHHSYMRPPVRWKPAPRVTGALAPIALVRVHGFSSPVAPEKSHARWLYQEWGKLLPELYDRGYWSNRADPGFPFPFVYRLRDEIPECHKLGVKGWRGRRSRTTPRRSTRTTWRRS